MILAELVGVVVSFVSILISQPPQISCQDPQRQSGSSSEENQELEAPWQDMINREYEQEDSSELEQQTDCYTSDNYVSVGRELRIRPRIWLSLQRVLRANAGIVIAVIPLGLLAVALVYFYLKLNSLCFNKEYKNNTIPISVRRWQLINEDIAAICLFIWFPVTLALLFGWKEFKLNYISTVYIGGGFGATSMIYQAFMVLYGLYGTKVFYRYPADALFLVNIIYSSIVVARKFRTVHPSTAYSSFHIFFMISISFVAASALAFIYKYSIVPYYNQLENEIDKVIMAAITPAVALIPTAIGKYLALRQSSEMIEPDRSFLLAYFLRGATIGLYRIMQADFKSITLFIGLSLLHGFSNVFSKATERLREKMWTVLTTCLSRTCCGRRLQLLPLNTPHHRRLKADIEIQNMLFEYTMLVLSQAYLVLYLITTFDISPWPVIKASLIRIAIGFGIDFVFNCISVFIQIHYHDVPMRRVWFKFWKRHVIANAIVLVATLSYLTLVLRSVFATRGNESGKEYAIKNCTLPFDSW